MRFYNAGFEDIDFLVQSRLEVLREVFGLGDDEDLSGLAEANREYYRQCLSGGEHVACVVFDEDAIVGCGGLCLHREMPSPENETGKCGHLMNIYVRKEYRCKGVGEQIVRWLIEQAKKHGVVKITLDATAEGKPLYESIGFITLSDCMRLKLVD